MGKDYSEMFRKNVQEFTIRFSALKRGTGKYKKGWLHIFLGDKHCDILSHKLYW